jgi:hypothetical protein
MKPQVDQQKLEKARLLFDENVCSNTTALGTCVVVARWSIFSLPLMMMMMLYRIG